MPNTALIPALAKALLAIAWADGELHAEEEATLKEVIGLLPALSAQEWATIEVYLLAPIRSEERAELLQLLIGQIRSAEDKRIALEAVDTMLRADGAITPDEVAIAHELQAAIQGTDVSVLGLVRRAVGGALRATPGREARLDLWRSNPIVYMLQLEGELVSGPEVEVAALAAGVMAQVVRLTPDHEAAVRPVMVAALGSDWYVPEVADALATAALRLSRRNIDFHRISRELARRSPERQRVALLDTLFAIANAANNVVPGEIDEIRVIAERLNLTRQEFIAAKLKIPASERGGL